MTIREIYTAAANHFGVPVHDEEFLAGVPRFHGLRAPDNTQLTVDTDLSDDDAELITRWAVDQTAYRAGIRQGILGRRTRKEARQLGNVHDRVVYDPDTRAAYKAAIQAGIAAVRAATTDPDDPNAPTLPVLDDELRLTDGTTARVLQRYDATLSRVMTGNDAAWQVTGPTGARVISLDQVAGYVAHEPSDVDHAAALVLNAALDWETACQRGFVTEHMAAADELHKAIRAWAALVAE